MKGGRNADLHFIELAPFEMSVNEDNIAPGGSVTLSQMIGAIEDLPSAPGSSLDLGETGGFRIAARTQRRIEHKLGLGRLLAVERCDPRL